MRFQGCMRFRLASKLAKISAASSLLILVACGTTQAPPAPAAPGIQTSKVKTVIKPLSCSEFDPVTYSNGKPGATVGDVQEALKSPDNPLGKARNILGDTNVTKGQIDVYMAERARLCPK
jgi:hypothetical protein